MIETSGTIIALIILFLMSLLFYIPIIKMGFSKDLFSRLISFFSGVAERTIKYNVCIPNPFRSFYNGSFVFKSDRTETLSRIILNLGKNFYNDYYCKNETLILRGKININFEDEMSFSDFLNKFKEIYEKNNYTIKFLFVKEKEGYAEVFDTGTLNGNHVFYIYISNWMLDESSFLFPNCPRSLDLECYIKEEIRKEKESVYPFMSYTPYSPWEKSLEAWINLNENPFYTVFNDITQEYIFVRNFICSYNKSVYNPDIDGPCWDKTFCGYLNKSLICCEKKVIICVD